MCTSQGKCITLLMRGVFIAGCPYMVVELNEEWEGNHPVGSDKVDLQNLFLIARECQKTFENFIIRKSLPPNPQCGCIGAIHCGLYSQDWFWNNYTLIKHRLGYDITHKPRSTSMTKALKQDQCLSFLLTEIVVIVAWYFCYKVLQDPRV